MKTSRLPVCVAALGLLAAFPAFSPVCHADIGAQAELSKEVSQACKEADATLDAAYRQLIGKLDEHSQQQLREAQRAWVAFRDAQADARAGLGGCNGKKSVVGGDEVLLDLTNTRTSELQRMLKELPAS